MSERDESRDNYPKIVAKLNSKWRVIRCKADIQWILQRHKSGEWRGRSFCRTKEALLRCCGEYAGAIDPSAMAILTELPPTIEHRPELQHGIKPI
jgi:hypothetical protein